MKTLLFIVAAVLIFFWVVGFFFKFVVSPLIHLALIIGVVVLGYNLITNRQALR